MTDYTVYESPPMKSTFTEVASRSSYLERLGERLLRSGHASFARSIYSHLLEMIPGSIAALDGLAASCLTLGDFDQATRLYRELHCRRPIESNYLVNLANAYVCQGAYEAARVCFKVLSESVPNDKEAVLAAGLFDLLMEDLPRGFTRYEARRDCGRQTAQRRGLPLWDGRSLAGKRILIFAEQGLGDTVQFLRYVPLVVERGAQVVLEVQSRLVDVITRCDGVIEVAELGRSQHRAEWQQSLMSLPHVFQTSIETIPKPLCCFKSRHAATLPAAAGKLRVGLVWSGNRVFNRNYQRSLSPRLLQRLTGLAGAQLYSFQRDASAGELREAFGDRIIDAESDSGELADTIGLMSQMDLIISVDTAMAHVAATLGKEVWVLLAYTPDWRWFLNRPTSPWYPSVYLYRQTEVGDWQSVIDHVYNDLYARTADSETGVTALTWTNDGGG